MKIIWILASIILVSLISFVGIVTLALKDRLLKSILFCMISFSAGSLIGGAFLHIMPEVLEKSPSINAFSYFIAGIVLFFFLERYLHWRHCHEGKCDVHAFTYLNLIGDGFHNFMDGMVIAAGYVISIELGVVTTLAVIFHEIPQELGDFAVLVYGGFSKVKALFFNFLSALTAVLGAVIGYFLSSSMENFGSIILPITAGGFVYIATSDLIPEIHKEADLKRSTMAFIAFLVGIAFMALARTLFEG